MLGEAKDLLVSGILRRARNDIHSLGLKSREAEFMQ